MAFTLEENNFIRQFYPNDSKETIMAKIHRPWQSIITQACKLGIKRNIRSDSFTLKEEQLLKDIFEHNTKKYIIEKFKEAGFKRSAASIFLNARRLGLKRDPELIKQDMIEGGKKAPTPSNIILWTENEDNKLRAVYPNGNKEEIMKMFPGRTWKAIREHCIRLGLSRSKEKIDEDRAKHLKENLGVTSTWQLEKVKEKSRQTNLERRGVEYPTQSPEVWDKIQKKVQKKYGVNNVFQSEEIKKRARETNLKNLGVENPNQSPIVRARTRATNQKRYGVDNTFQIIDRVQQGMLKKYGEKSPLKVPEIKAQQQATNIERYGAPTPAQNEDVQKKIELTNIDRYGTPSPLQNEEIKQRITETNIKRYGVDNPLKSSEIQNKARQSLYNHGTQKCSKQQAYIAKLLNGKINYPVGNCNVDILLEENIICEYDGGGHDLTIKLGSISEKEFIEQERRREIFLKLKGFSTIRIISKDDLLPSDEVLLRIISEGTKYLKTGHSWINFDIDQKKIICSKFNTYYNFGVLRKIYE